MCTQDLREGCRPRPRPQSHTHTLHPQPLKEEHNDIWGGEFSPPSELRPRARPCGNVSSKYLSWTHSLAGWSRGVRREHPCLWLAPQGVLMAPQPPWSHRCQLPGVDPGPLVQGRREETETAEPALVPGFHELHNELRPRRDS